MSDGPPPSSEVSCQEVREKADAVSAAINRFRERQISPPKALRPLLFHLVTCGDCRAQMPRLVKNYKGFPPRPDFDRLLAQIRVV
nr:hypothetical protein [uncultured archaeon]